MKNGKGADIAAMIACASKNLTAGLSRIERERLAKHDPSNPFMHTSIERNTSFQKTDIRLKGNQVSDHRPKWIKEDGSEFETPDRLTYDWVLEQANDIAEQITSAGVPASVCEGVLRENIREGKVVVRVPDIVRLQSNMKVRYPANNVTAYWLTIHTVMQGITGEKAEQRWTINSAGRSDIGKQIVKRLQALTLSMPGTPEEAEMLALEKARHALNSIFLPYAIEPRILSVKRNTRAIAMTIEIEHEMLDSMLQWVVIKTNLTFYGNDFEQPWGAHVSDLGGERNAYKLIAEASRRKTLQKNGGLLQTSLAREVMEKLNYKENPFRAGWDGKVKTKRYVMSGTSQTKGTLSIKNGRIEATMNVLDGKIKLSTGTFEIEDVDFPESGMNGAKNMPLRAVIDHPAIPEDVIIVSMAKHKNGIKGRHRMPNYPVSKDEE